MAGIVYIDEDIVRVTKEKTNKIVDLAWGDPIEVVGYDKATKRTTVKVHGRSARPFTGTVKGKPETRKKGILQFSMVDVQQGDAIVLQTPEGKTVFIDGGENKLFARYTANRYRKHTADDPLDVEAIIVTHGDADHCIGFNHMVESETDGRKYKRIFVRPKRVFHNGLVKGPSNLKDEKSFGRTAKSGEETYVVDLYTDPTTAPADRMNKNFQKWMRTLKHWKARNKRMSIKRLEAGKHSAFRFLKKEGIDVKVLGPITEEVNVDGSKCPGLPLLRQPPKTVVLPLDPTDKRKSPPFSASHTINGHSIALRIQFGNVRFFLSGDLNQESMKALREKAGPKLLQCEILKVPHHGSGDFDMKALKDFAPVVSLISSGDESSRTEYIHPRATLMSALGKVSRSDLGLVLCTELVAFFALRGNSVALDKLKKSVKAITLSKVKKYFGFERTNFGIIQVRTDGERVLVFTHSGKEHLMEAYSFTVDKAHNVTFADKVKTR